MQCRLSSKRARCAPTNDNPLTPGGGAATPNPRRDVVQTCEISSASQDSAIGARGLCEMPAIFFSFLRLIATHSRREGLSRGRLRKNFTKENFFGVPLTNPHGLLYNRQAEEKKIHKPLFLILHQIENIPDNKVCRIRDIQFCRILSHFFELFSVII